MTKPDQATLSRIVTAADERAAYNGCRFNERRAAHVVTFFRRFLRHSKGSDFAGQPFELLDWQRENVIYPVFGWERPDGTRRYRKTYIEVPKKNGKSTLAAGIGLYLLIGDNEPGAEVYSTAVDQQQAGIVHDEAVNMVEASPELTSILRLNRSTKVISFDARKSKYKALSGEAPSKEGLNAHGIIADELHVWRGDALWNTLKYAFAARRQPLLFAITTAGDDPLSVCFQQHLYAKRILTGEIDGDDRFFAYISAADPTDEWTEPATWIKANPSMGSTIRLDDFAADVEEAKRTPMTQTTFKRYRLNVWATATSPWLRPEDWKACQQNFSAHDLLGMDCYGGLDLAKTRDMTAFVLVFFDGPDKYKLIPHFWLPEATVHDLDAPEDYRQWARDGFLEVTPGSVCDYSFVEKRIVEISQQYNLRGFAYDPYNAESTTQRLEELHGIPRTAFGQTITNYAEPTAEFERLLVSKKLSHNGHPILTWQAGNVNVRTDANNNRRPVKPEAADSRKIDGIVAAIMGLALAIEDDTVRESALIYQ